MPFQTRITDLLGIKYPIIGGSMMGLSRAEFAAAISNAGGLGMIVGAIFRDSAELRDEIRKTKDLTDKPFAINFALMPSLRPVNLDSYLDVIFEESVAVLETSGRSPKEYIERIKQSGIKFMHKCARAKDAVSVERLGAEAVSVVGFECGGHPGLDDTTSMVLVPMAVDAVTIPVIAGGGIADGRGLVAALALGAEGVVMGTRFMATKECPAHENVKQWMLRATEADTMVVQRSIKSNIRVMKNAASIRIQEMEARGATLEELIPIISGDHGREVYQDGLLDAGTLACGEIVGMIKDIPTVAEVVERTMREAEEVRRRLNSLTLAGVS